MKLKQGWRFSGSVVATLTPFINLLRKRGFNHRGIIAVSVCLALLISGCSVAPSPAEFKVTSFTVAPKEIITGETVTVTTMVENIGETEGIYRAVLIVDGAEEESRSITLAGGEKETVSFSVVVDMAGTHNIELGQFSDTFSVLKSAKFKVSSLDITPNPVRVGEEATVEIGIENVGGTGGTYIASLGVDGVVEQTRDITLAGGETGSLSFLISRNSPGSYNIETGGRTEILDVIEPVRLPTGTLLVKTLHGMGTLKIQNELGSDTVAVLTSTEEPDIALLAVYVQADDSCEIARVTDGTYFLYFTFGEDWDDGSRRFIGNPRYQRFDDEFEWETTIYKNKRTYHIWTFTLRPRQIVLSEDEFPDLG